MQNKKTAKNNVIQNLLGQHKTDQNITQQERIPKNLVPIEKKMALAQYIREENMDNRMKIRQREKILYGTENSLPLWEKSEPNRMNDTIRPGENPEEMMQASSNTFRLRMAAAILLFIGFLLCDAGQYQVFGYSMNDIYGMISEDYFKIYDAQDIEELPQLTELLQLDFEK